LKRLPNCSRTARSWDSSKTLSRSFFVFFY
jgi:hypothetical protein